MRTHHLFLAVLAGASLSAAATTPTAAAATSDALPQISSTTGGDSSTTTTAAKSAASSATTTNPSSASSSGTSQTFAASSPASKSANKLTGLPTIAGATDPTIVVPYTAGAPFMQKSDYPEGTVFIAVGAVLAFLGACVLAWRAVVAWTINRSVKRAALASIMASDTKTKYGPGGKLYAAPQPSSLSLEALSPTGKPLTAGNRPTTRKEQARDPSSLFFSPTANPAAPPPMAGLTPMNRSSTYLPAGYYAAPSAHVAGGRESTVIGGPQPSYSRHSRVEQTPPASRDGSRTRGTFGQPRGTPNYLSPNNMYAQASTSSLAVGTGAYPDESPSRGGSNLPGERAPSAYFEDLLENHGSGPRERF